MFDPAAMATFLIGLELVQAEAHDNRRRQAVSVPRREHAGVRVALARGLRRAAGAIEPRTLGVVADEGYAP